MRFLFFFLTILVLPSATSASYVVPYTSVENSRLVEIPLPTASSKMMNELKKCEESQPEQSYFPPCGYVYSAPVDSSSSSVIVELCRGSSSFKPGLYIFRGDSGAWYYPWFDAGVMDFACKYKNQVGEGEEGEPVYYGVVPDRELGFQSLVYQYYVNLTAGHAYFLLLPDSKIRVLDRNDENLPS